LYEASFSSTRFVALGPLLLGEDRENHAEYPKTPGNPLGRRWHPPAFLPLLFFNVLDCFFLFNYTHFFSISLLPNVKACWDKAFCCILGSVA